jgi:hypothetical protein
MPLTHFRFRFLAKGTGAKLREAVQRISSKIFRVNGFAFPALATCSLRQTTLRHRAARAAFADAEEFGGLAPAARFSLGRLDIVSCFRCRFDAFSSCSMHFFLLMV